MLGIKQWLEEDGNLNRNDHIIHSDSFSRKLKVDIKWCHLLAITLYPTLSKLENICILVISNNKSFTSQNLKAEGLLGGKFDFSVPQDLKFKAILITEPEVSLSDIVRLHCS